MEVVIRTHDWEELLKALKTRTVGFYKFTENGYLYAPLKGGGLIDTNPEIVAEYLTKQQ